MSQEPKMTFFQPGDEKNYPQDGDRVEVQYKGFLQDGTQFEASDQLSNGSLKFTLGKGEVIKCWEYALRKMSLGSKVKVKCPSEMAYGAQGVPGKIPRDENIWFYIKLLNYK